MIFYINFILYLKFLLNLFDILALNEIPLVELTITLPTSIYKLYFNVYIRLCKHYTLVYSIQAKILGLYFCIFLFFSFHTPFYILYYPTFSIYMNDEIVHRYVIRSNAYIIILWYSFKFIFSFRHQAK